MFIQEVPLSNKTNQNLSSPVQQASGIAVNGASQPNVPACKYVTACLGVCVGVCMHVWGRVILFTAEHSMQQVYSCLATSYKT